MNPTRARNYPTVSSKTLALLIIGPLLLTLSALTAQAASPALKFRLKGSDFTVEGIVQSYDGAKYLVETPRFGPVQLDAAKFDCIGAQCPSPTTAGTAPATPAQPGKQASPAPASAATSTAALATPPANAPPQKIARSIVISGTEAIGEILMPQLIEAYAASIGATARPSTPPEGKPAKYILQPAPGGGGALEFEIRKQGTSQGFADLESGAAQIVMASRPIANEEAVRMSAKGLGDFRLPTHEHVLALDGLMVLVAPRNPAVSMPIETLAKVLSGEISDWSQLNLPPGKITVYTAPATHGTNDTLTGLLLQPRGLALTKAAQTTISNADLADRVSRDPNGLGISAITPRPTAKALTIETSCGLIVKPSLFVVKTEEYPLSRLLYLYTAGDPSDPAARALLAFALSPAAQPVIAKLDLVDQGIQTLSFPDQTDRLAYALNAAPEDFDLKLAREMISELRTRQRLSITFRFQAATDYIGAKGIADLDQLITYLSAKENLAKRVTLVGFADSSGTFPTNLKLSERRTASVYRALLSQGQGKFDPARVTTHSYGKLAPIACNDTLTHRALNRRVEVWVQN